ncbi:MULTISPECIES: site-specific integrase [Bacteroidales]|uniref:site-specific integrase n=1 Tax=uncultured Alistipes sp. TaxID=538949 RepID=UPI00260EAB07|nr:MULTISPECIES: site-specific integrase [Bacteroidales]
MGRSTFSVAFYVRKTRMNKHGQAAIVVRVTVNGIRADLAAQKLVNPKLWDTAKGKAYERTPLTRELNMYLDSVRAKLIRIHRDMEEDDAQNVTAQAVIHRYLGKDKPERHTLMELFREHNERCRALSGIDMAPATVLRYETSLRHTEQFLLHIYRKQDIYLDELNRQFMMDYEFYLKSVRRCNHNSATKYLKNFKKIVRLALLDKEWLDKDPFSGIKFKFEQVERDFLEMHEVEKLRRKQIDIPRLEQVRDVFVFCCYTGLAFTDVKQLTQDHIATDIHGAKWIRKPRQKTGNVCHIPLLEVPLKILDKYKAAPYCQTHGVLLPVLCNQKMNAYLKELADICGIRKQISTHMSQHTFATCMLANGVSMESVAKMLGHSDTKMTRHYARILDSTVYREMQNVQGALRRSDR